MKTMVFKNAKLASGEDWPNRWISEDGEYAIHRYTYWNKYGRACGPADKCEPYFRAYRTGDGKSLAGKNAKVASFYEATRLCMDDAKERGVAMKHLVAQHRVHGQYDVRWYFNHKTGVHTIEYGASKFPSYQAGPASREFGECVAHQIKAARRIE